MTITSGGTHTRQHPVQFWSRLGQAHVHPDDVPFLDASRVFPGRLPQPWTGPLLHADTFVLYGNPGVEGSEAAYETRNGAFRDALAEQRLGNTANVFLDPRFADHPGNRWTRQKLGRDIVYSEIAERMCTIELFPYAGRNNAYGRRLADRLPSCKMIRGWVHAELAPRARRGDIALIVMRAARPWGFAPGEVHNGLFVALPGQSRGAFLTGATDAGRALRKQLSMVPRRRY